MCGSVKRRFSRTVSLALSRFTVPLLPRPLHHPSLTLCLLASQLHESMTSCMASVLSLQTQPSGSENTLGSQLSSGSISRTITTSVKRIRRQSRRLSRSNLHKAAYSLSDECLWLLTHANHWKNGAKVVGQNLPFVGRCDHQPRQARS